MVTYLIRLISMIVTAVIVVIGLCYLVDPYAVYGSARIDGLTARKPFAHNRPREAKEALFKRVDSSVVLLGDSRVDLAFDPQRLATTNPAGIFNFGIPGDGVGGLRRQYLFAAGLRPQKTVMVGLDFINFLVSQPSSIVASQAVPKAGAGRLHVERLLSATALLHTAQTLWGQRSPWANSMTPQGFNDRRGYARIIQREGQFALFEEKNRDYWLRQKSRSSTIYDASGELSPGFEQLGQLIDDAAKHSDALWIFNYPFHQQMHLLFEKGSLTSAHSEWIAQLQRVVLSKQKEHPGLDIRLLVIPAYNEMNVEEVPAMGDRATTLEHYWESVHFRTRVGAEIYRLLSRDDCWQAGKEVSALCQSRLLARASRTEEALVGVVP